MSDKAPKSLRWVASTETIHLKKEYKCAFKKDSNGSLLNKTLVEDGLSSVRALLIQGMKVFILLLTVVKLTGSGSNGDKTEMAKVLGQFVSNEMVTQVIILK
jgi:hypothetical protein